jgi:hypothetical protein
VCGKAVTRPKSFEEAAFDLLVGRLKTQLQVEQNLALAFEEAFRAGERNILCNALIEPRPTAVP